MDVNTENDWKTKMGFPINYDSGQSTDDDFDSKDVVMRNPRSSSRYLLADGGDGAEADLLGTTPPRARIRDKEKRKNFLDSGASLQRIVRDKKDVVDSASPDSSPVSEKLRKRSSLKVIRSKERDFKLDMSQQNKADSLPSPNPTAPPVPTLVESCSRFMSLTSKPKSRDLGPETETEVDERWPQERDEELPANRVNFHKTFSMLINMGNIDKTCRRTISREEQVWQNELKDLIWLELQARVAGRSLAAHDAWLCAQRRQVGRVLHSIAHYRFENKNPCRRQASRTGDTSSREELTDNQITDEDVDYGCLQLDCQCCADAVGEAMREVGALLDSFYNAVSLYPSSKAMTADLPLVATNMFKNRLKAMCLWFNTALNMRLKMLAVQRILRSMKQKSHHRAPTTPDVSRQSSETHRNCAVRFNVSTDPTPTGSSNSDSSYAKEDDNKDSRAEGPEKREGAEKSQEGSEKSQEGSEKSQEGSEKSQEGSEKSQEGSEKSQEGSEKSQEGSEKSQEGSEKSQEGSEKSQEGSEKSQEGSEKSQEGSEKSQEGSEKSQEGSEKSQEGSEKSQEGSEKSQEGCEETNPEKREDEVDSGVDSLSTGRTDSRYSTAESSDAGSPWDAGAAPYDAYHVGPLSELTQLVVLNKTTVSLYREHHQEILKTQGVRRCMTFVNKMRKNILYKVFLTLEKPHTQGEPSSDSEEGPAEVFHEGREDDDKPDADAEGGRNELRRYGCWSEECLSMRLPSYRAHFLLLCSISMEAVHDYLTLRLEVKPERPSCLTVKQLMNELRDGLDIATEMRADFVRNVQVALVGRSAGVANADLLLLVNTFDSTVETMLQVYLSYLSMVSAQEPLRRGALQAEWSFVARLACRLRAAHRLAPRAFAKIACNQLDRLHTLFQDKFKRMQENEGQLEPDRARVFALCREAQAVFAGEREHVLHAAHWARALAARLARAPPPAFIHERRDMFNSLMAIRDFIVKQVEFILEQSAALTWEVSEPIVTRVRELLLQICKLGFELHRELQALTAGGARRARPASLQAPPRARPARAPRPGTVLGDCAATDVRGIHKELHRFATDPSLERSAPPPPCPPRGRFTRLDSVLDDTDSDAVDNIQFIDGRAACEAAPAQADAEGAGAGGAGGEERRWARGVARAVVDFAKCWMKFVLERCDRGRGLRPRWASQGLEFLMLACDPCNTKHLTEQEFEELKKLMDACISHVIGSRPAPDCAASPRPRHRLHSPFSNSSCGKDIPTPPTPPAEPDLALGFTGPDTSGHSRRVLEAVATLERGRERALRARGRVGRVVSSAVPEYEPRLRQLSFNWQRGLKIGAGSFGKVYTVVNTESGQLLAMKELSVGADRRGSQRAAHELRVLEGVLHPHLVRYYGCELHREEMLIFMELCVEGSLEALVATAGALPEGTVRRYCKQLLSAVAALHARTIAHRDIKSGNIFLTNEGHCLKLGDFGCAVKIRANTTAPNELQGFVGTQAYMAPEVFMKSSGHGRAADIWSVGCCVTEMASGKRPFAEYDSNYQIMFMVGMGARPAIPPTLSEEGRQFCALCLTHEPELRPRADTLTMHTFLMVKADEDCNCEPGVLITPPLN